MSMLLKPMAAAAAQGFLPVPDPVAFTVFGVDIYWYAVCVTLGMVAGVTLGYVRAKKFGLDPEHVLDLALWALPIGIIGARLYYVAFTWDYYSQHLNELFNTRNGGLAIHGGLILGIATALILFKRWKNNPWSWLDLMAPCIAIGQCIGRWGNYFNSEAHGVATDLPWAILCDGELVHPTFLYESISCLLLCLFLLSIDGTFGKKKKKLLGSSIAIYGIWYSIERFFVEGLRTDSLYMGSLRTAQVISLATVAGCVLLLVYLKNNQTKIAAIQNAEVEADSEDGEVSDKNE